MHYDAFQNFEEMSAVRHMMSRISRGNAHAIDLIVILLFVVSVTCTFVRVVEHFVKCATVGQSYRGKEEYALLPMSSVGDSQIDRGCHKNKTVLSPVSFPRRGPGAFSFALRDMSNHNGAM